MRDLDPQLVRRALVVIGGRSNSYHLDPKCHYFLRSKPRKRSLKDLRVWRNDAEPCPHCVVGVENPTCGECEGILDPYGDCPFCEALRRVLAGEPVKAYAD